MTALTDRIATVLRAHEDAFINVDCTGAGCQCGWSGGYLHVAARIAEALQLTEERRVHVPWANEPKPVAVDAVITAEVLKDEHRWVSEWAEMEEQPAPAGFAPICEGCGGANSRHFYLCSRAAVEGGQP